MKKRSKEILGGAFLVVLLLCALLHLIAGNFAAFGGWAVAVCWFINSEINRLEKEGTEKFADLCYDENIRLYGVVERFSDENAELRARIREMESENKGDEK